MAGLCTLVVGAVLLAGGARAEPPVTAPRPAPRPSDIPAAVWIAAEVRAATARAHSTASVAATPATAVVARSDAAAAPGLWRSPRPVPRALFARAPLASGGAAHSGLASGASLVRPAAAATLAQAPRPRAAPDGRRRGVVQRVFAPQRTGPVPEAILGQRTDRLLDISGLVGETIPPIRGRIAGCGVDRPLRVSEVAGVRLSPPAVMDADTARALVRWVERGAKPAVGRRGGGVSELRIAAHYACRTRNHRAGARISEHGRGRAIDISAVVLANGEVLTVQDDYRRGRTGRILRAMHKAACGPFGTTLGPGSDGMHEDHFHFDTARHRSGPYCR